LTTKNEDDIVASFLAGKIKFAFLGCPALPDNIEELDKRPFFLKI
jgi:hypothetical protein